MIRRGIKTLAKALLDRPIVRRIVCWRVCTPLPVVALTFDDGPVTEFTPRVLDILKAYDARATFFILGKRVQQNPELVKRIAFEGHELANHGYDHRLEGIVAQVKCCNQILLDLGFSTRLFRPPCGILDIVTFLRLWWSGYSTAFWSFDTHDSMRAEGKWPDILPDYRLVKAGDIVLMHDDNERCLSELPVLLDLLKAKAITPVTMSKLLSATKTTRSASAKYASSETVGARV